jgi:hypothetical protein
VGDEEEEFHRKWLEGGEVGGRIVAEGAGWGSPPKLAKNLPPVPMDAVHTLT